MWEVIRTGKSGNETGRIQTRTNFESQNTSIIPTNKEYFKYVRIFFIYNIIYSKINKGKRSFTWVNLIKYRANSGKDIGRSKSVFSVSKFLILRLPWTLASPESSIALSSGIVLGSFYYGYVALQIPGGYLALVMGGTRLFGLAILLASVLTLFTAVAARIDVLLLIALRISEGLVLVSYLVGQANFDLKNCVLLFTIRPLLTTANHSATFRWPSG